MVMACRAMEDGMAKQLGTEAIGRVIRSLLAGELAAMGKRITHAEASLWPDDLTVDAEGIGVDSLGRLACAAAVNAFFRLHEVGVEDYLLAERSLARWAEIVAFALGDGTSGITFMTSGSTGEPKPCPHDHATLAEETAHWAGVFADRQRIVQLVPAHHLYGFLFTILLPERLGVPVCDLRAAGAGTLARMLGAGDLIVGHPAMLALLVRMLPTLPAGIVVASSTAPLPRATEEALRARGAAAVHEIYGSSETAGIASRTDPDRGFVLLPRWRQGGAGDAASIIAAASGMEMPLPDRVAWQADGSLVLQGRKDGAVQVAGINVFPAAIAERIAARPGVAECVVRLDQGLSEPRLKAFVVPRPDSTAADGAGDLADALERWAVAELAEAERPIRFDIGPALPRNEMGKLVDWARAG